MEVHHRQLLMGIEMLRQFVILLTITSVPAAAFAHGGGLDRHGCHHDRRNGRYHCHRGAAAVSQVGADYQQLAERARRARQNAALASRASYQAVQTRASQLGAMGRAFVNCTEARLAGAAPVYRGQPGYGQHLDRDNDGVGCEPWRGR